VGDGDHFPRGRKLQWRLHRMPRLLPKKNMDTSMVETFKDEVKLGLMLKPVEVEGGNSYFTLDSSS
jgi:hypothetical protein